MHAPSKPLRVALVGLTAGSLALLAACGSGETQAADGSSSGDKTIAFSPLALKIPAMKGLSEGVTHYGDSKGYEVLVQDPNLDPQKQVTDLQSVIESGRVAGAWAISIDASSMKALVAKAQKDEVPLILNGTPELYGFDGP